MAVYNRFMRRKKEVKEAKLKPKNIIKVYRENAPIEKKDSLKLYDAPPRDKAISNFDLTYIIGDL
jgi:hypothetical protein